MAGLQRATVTQVFNGQSGIYVFEEVSNYDTATLDTILANGFDVGQVFNGSTEWTGEDASFDNITDEQGDIIVSNPTAGTYGFDFEMADFSAEKWKTFLKGKEITVAEAVSSIGTDASAKVVSVSGEMPVIERPVLLGNDAGDKFILLPKARILTSPAMEDKLWVLKASVMAQDCNTANLGTMMYIPKGKLTFGD